MNCKDCSSVFKHMYLNVSERVGLVVEERIG